MATECVILELTQECLPFVTQREYTGILRNTETTFLLLLPFLNHFLIPSAVISTSHKDNIWKEISAAMLALSKTQTSLSWPYYCVGHSKGLSIFLLSEGEAEVDCLISQLIALVSSCPWFSS